MAITQRIKAWGERFKRSVPGQVGSRIGEHSVMSLSAALSYYTIVSLAPLITLLLWLTTTLYPAAQQSFFDQISRLAGPQVEQTARTVVHNAESQPGVGSIAAWLGTIALLFASSIVFGQLQLALNRIFGSPSVARQGAWAWIRKRLLSLGMVFGIGFLLVVSMVVQAGVQLVADQLPSVVPAIVTIVALALYALVFAAIYRFVPDCPVTGRLALVGGVLTAVLFVVGRWAIGLYLGNASMGSAYGPAGGLVVMLVWVYYSAVVFLIGAEATAVLEERHAIPKTTDDERRIAERRQHPDRRRTADRRRDDRGFGGMQPA